MHSFHVQPLHRSPIVSIDDVSCRPERAGCGQEERVHRPSIAFVRRGLFVKHVGRRRVVADPNHVVFFDPALPYRVSHPETVGDDCTAFAFAPALVCEAFGGGFPAPGALGDPRAVIVQHGIRRLAASGGAGALELDELCLRLLRQVAGASGSVRDASRSTAAMGGRRHRKTDAAHRRLTDRVRSLLVARFADPLSLAEIARVTHSSPYHLSRVFHRQVGLPMHRYRNRLRLRAALERLVDPRARLIDIALDLGFSSHGHLTVAFHREFGITPSAFRRRLSRSLLLQLSKNLEA